MKRWLMCLMTCITCACLQAHEGHAVGGAAGVRTELGASAAFDLQGGVWMAGKEPAAEKGQGYVVVRHSADGGKTWSPPVRVNAQPEAIAAEGESLPKIAIGRNGEIFVSWTSPLAKPYTGNIRFARSLDGGQRFSDPVTVNRDRRLITHRFDSLGVDAQGDVYIVWIDKRDLEDAKQRGTAYRGAAVYAAVSNDAGASFAREFKIDDHSCECCRLALTPAREGGMWVMWRHVFAPNIRDHAAARIGPDGRIGHASRVSWEDWRIDACPHHGPSLVEDDKGELHAVWFSLGNQPGIKYGRLQAGKQPLGLRVVGESAAAHADLASSGEQLAIVWMQFDGKQTQLRALRSSDRGQTWTEQVLARTAQAAAQPRLLQHAGRFHVFWNTQEVPLQVVPLP